MEKDKAYYESLDKRSKEYKEWKANQEIEIGSPNELGDKVEKVLKKTRIAKAAKFLLGEDCGCEERKTKLNDLFRGNPQCATKEEYDYLTWWFSKRRTSVKKSEQIKLIAIYNRVLRKNRTHTSCSSCIAEVCRYLERYYNTYKDNVDFQGKAEFKPETVKLILGNEYTFRGKTFKLTKKNLQEHKDNNTLYEVK